MRQVFLSVAFCLTLTVSTAEAQNSHDAAGGARLPGKSGSRFVLADVSEQVVREFHAAWQQSGLGTLNTEAVVLVLRNSDGSCEAVSAGRTNQSNAFTFIWNPAIIAIIHTHPNDRDPKPQEQDILIARRFDIPIFTITLRGMHMYDPASNKITKIKSGVDWLDSSSWITNTHLAVKEPSKR